MASPIVTWLLSLISGAVGGNIGGALIKGQSLGPIVNTILGLIGGVGGSQLLGALGGLQSLGQIGNIGASVLSERCSQLSSAFSKTSSLRPESPRHKELVNKIYLGVVFRSKGEMLWQIDLSNSKQSISRF